MTEEAPVDSGGGEQAAPTTPTNASPPADLADNSTPQGGDSADSTPDGGDSYALPDEYKEKSWAGKIKSEGDLYKQIDNLTELVGKKTISPIDYNSATPEDVTAYHKSLVPEDATAYKFGEDSDPEFAKAIVPALQESGIHPAQLKTLEPAINKIASELVGAQHAADRSEDGYFELTQKAFGENHKDTVAQLEAAYKEHVSDDTKAFLDNASNTDRVAFDQTVKSIIDAKDAEIAAIRKEYGAEETGAQGEGEPATQRVSIDDQIKAKREEIITLEGKAGQKDWNAVGKAKDDLKALYSKKVKLNK